MDSSPPGYVQPNMPYGQSTLLHGDDNPGTATKVHSHQSGFGNSPNAAYPPPAGPPQYPNPPPDYSPYGAPPYGHPMGPGYAPAMMPPPPPPQQQQQQSVVVVTGETRHRPVFVSHVQSFAGHIILACFVAWCCCAIFGIIAFILASQ